MKRAVIVGGGAAGGVAAKALQGAFAVTVLERGGEFRRFGRDLRLVERLKRLGLLFDARLINLIFPAMRVTKTAEGMALISGQGLGGTTTLAAGNGLRLDADLKALGIDLDQEFDELAREIPISTGHQARWRDSTKHVYDICRKMGLEPRPLPKMADAEKCVNCGRCVLGCPSGAKWDARRFLDDAVARGAKVVTACAATSLALDGGKAKGVVAKSKGRRRFYPADLVVLAAGGFGTPVILENSGIRCQPNLFVDPVLCVAAEWPGARQDKEISMPFVVERPGFIVCPYFDFLSYFFNRNWKLRAGDTMSLMIKFADENRGRVSKKGVDKPLTPADRSRLEGAVHFCKDIYGRLGVPEDRLFFGTLNAGHPGGTLPLTEAEAATLHSPRLPENVYVADPTLFPASLGNPPSLTLMALAKRVCLAAAARCA